jgi:hypothetical protein
MKKTAPKKMKLSRETVGTLANDQVKAAQGGAQAGGVIKRPDVPWTSNSVNVCCA